MPKNATEEYFQSAEWQFFSSTKAAMAWQKDAKFSVLKSHTCPIWASKKTVFPTSSVHSRKAPLEMKETEIKSLVQKKNFLKGGPSQDKKAKSGDASAF